MEWDEKQKQIWDDLPEKQKKIFEELIEEERKILVMFGDDPPLDIHEISKRTNIPTDRLVIILNDMAKKGLLKEKWDDEDLIY